LPWPKRKNGRAERGKTANVVYDVHGFLSISFAIYGEKQFRFGLGFAQLKWRNIGQ